MRRVHHSQVRQRHRLSRITSRLITSRLGLASPRLSGPASAPSLARMRKYSRSDGTRSTITLHPPCFGAPSAARLQDA